MGKIKEEKKDESPLSTSAKELETSFIARMEFCAARAGSVTALAKKAGISQSGIRRYFSGGEPTRPQLTALAEAVGVSLVWLATGEGSPDSGPILAPTNGERFHGHALADVIDEYAPVPLYDVQAAAGHGAVVGLESVTDMLLFKRVWIHQELHANPSDLYLIHVDGESMEPTLRPGDVILVDRRNAQAVPRDGIYVMRMDDTLLVKRLQRLPGRKVKVTSDNPAYDPFELSLDDPGDDLAVIGRVVWSGRRM